MSEEHPPWAAHIGNYAIAQTAGRRQRQRRVHWRITVRPGSIFSVVRASLNPGHTRPGEEPLAGEGGDGEMRGGYHRSIMMPGGDGTSGQGGNEQLRDNDVRWRCCARNITVE